MSFSGLSFPITPRSFFIFFFLLTSTLLLITSCSHSGDSPFLSLEESAIGSKQSRDMKDNCLSCHAPGGSGNGIFMVGGTVFKNDLKTRYPNLTVRFYTQPNGGGELVKTLEVDAYGNFYTTGSLPFGKGLYPQVENGKGETRSMKTWLTSGACNSCHGVSTDPININ